MTTAALTIPEVIIGDNIGLLIDLTKDGASFTITTGTSTVTGVLVTLDRNTQLSGEIAMPEANPGSDWPNSRVSFVMSTVESAVAAMVVGDALLEIQVNEAGSNKTTWFVPVVIGKAPLS